MLVREGFIPHMHVRKKRKKKKKKKEREKRLLEMFSSYPNPSDFVLVWCPCIVKRVFVGVQLASKVPWGSSVYNFKEKYQFSIPTFIF